jgi:hypothetical protein
VFCIQDECRIQAFAVQVAWRLVVQHVQKVTGDAVIICFRVNTLAIGVESMPVKQHRGQAGEQSIGCAVLVAEITFGFYVAQERYAGPLYVHGMSVGRNHFQHLLQRLRQTP